MSNPELDYLANFRALAAKRDQINKAVSDLRAVCESLKNWRQTAAALGMPDVLGKRPEWDDAGVDRLRGLKQLFLDYHKLSQEVQAAWGLLPESSRLGLANPSELSTDQPPPS
jgi:hypothetical protein